MDVSLKMELAVFPINGALTEIHDEVTSIFYTLSVPLD